MDADFLVSVLKWTGVIIATGFIAQFGKKFADFLVERARRNKNAGVSPGPSDPNGKDAGTEPRKDRAKALKKIRKTETKMRKKAGD